MDHIVNKCLVQAFAGGNLDLHQVTSKAAPWLTSYLNIANDFSCHAKEEDDIPVFKYAT